MYWSQTTTLLSKLVLKKYSSYGTRQFCLVICHCFRFSLIMKEKESLALELTMSEAPLQKKKKSKKINMQQKKKNMKRRESWWMRTERVRNAKEKDLHMGPNVPGGPLGPLLTLNWPDHLTHRPQGTATNEQYLPPSSPSCT